LAGIEANLEPEDILINKFFTPRAIRVLASKFVSLDYLSKRGEIYA
jgi:hypothetical protein